MEPKACRVQLLLGRRVNSEEYLVVSELWPSGTQVLYKYCKIEAWNKVTFQLNAKGPIQQARSMEQLKAKYENLKTKARKCAAENRGYYRGTGGGPTNEPDWDPVVEAVLRVINEKLSLVS
ncbi:hypothetical protein JTB14_011214 [Gonioctena quinquepunctata]|nr:hypothetical protein JTB14_011214 [Gonioctena quinquepunctata]